MTGVPALRAGDLLAVYGLLRPQSHGLDRLNARARVEPLGPCRIRGVLYDLGAHPALADGDGEVAGDLLRLRDDDVGAVFDDFEDFDPRAPARSMYVRKRVTLIAPDSTAWLYVWNRSVDGVAMVASGDWLAR